MSRLSRYMQDMVTPTPLGPRRDLPGAVVIRNLIRRCNPTSKHCDSMSAAPHFPGELDTARVFSVMDDLKAARVPALIVSGSEPLLRPGIFEIAHRAMAMAFTRLCPPTARSSPKRTSIASPRWISTTWS